MRYRELGSTGLRVSEVGFGTWGIGGDTLGAIAYGPADESKSRSALSRAVDLGINFFDTSDFYGFGRSEELLGEVLRPVRSDVVIATKVGLLDAKGAQDFSADHIERSLEGSLRRLQTDYVDLYQLHDPPIPLLRADSSTIGTLERLRASGTIRVFGISLRNPLDGLPAIRDLGFQCLQVNFNLLDQRAIDDGLFGVCEARNIGVIVRTPLVFGFLTGRYSAEDRFDPLDHRRRWTIDQRKRWATAYRLFTNFFDHDGEETPAQFALRFCLYFGCVSTVIPGMLVPEHVEENAGASELGPLSKTTIREIGKIYQQHCFFTARA